MIKVVLTPVKCSLLVNLFFFIAPVQITINDLVQDTNNGDGVDICTHRYV